MSGCTVTGITRTGREKRATVHDFAQALVADISNSPEFRKNGDVSHHKIELHRLIWCERRLIHH